MTGNTCYPYQVTSWAQWGVLSTAVNKKWPNVNHSIQGVGGRWPEQKLAQRGPSKVRQQGSSKVSQKGPSKVSQKGPSKVSQKGTSKVSQKGPLYTNDVRTCG